MALARCSLDAGCCSDSSAGRVVQSLLGLEAVLRRLGSSGRLEEGGGDVHGQECEQNFLVSPLYPMGFRCSQTQAR